MKKLFKYSPAIISISFFLLPALFVSCSKIIKRSDEVNEVFGTQDYADAIVSKILPKWYEGESTNKNFVLKQNSNRDSVHMFFDVSPQIDPEKATLNFIVTTPESSSFSYHVDLLSGQHFQGKKFCKQSDIWGNYRETIYRPPFTFGIVPKILDRTGEAQKIIIFGGANYYSNNFTNNFFEARIVGGFIEQFCPSGACYKPKDWNSRLVLVGVQPGHKRYDRAKNVQELSRMVDWEAVKGFVENGQGRNKVAGNYFPGFRMGALIPQEQALKFIDKNSIYLKNSKLLKIRRSCHKLYDHIWSKVALPSKFETEIKKLRTNMARKVYIAKNPSKKSTFFHRRFRDGFLRYADEYKTCLRYIYPSNINENSKRHWFFAYYSAVHLLHDLGYSFDCSRGIWDRNPLLNNGRRLIAFKDEFKNCSGRKIDTAIASSTSFLERLRYKSFASYHYIDYDKAERGTHRKIYSWVKDSNKVFQCDSSRKIATRKFLFPKDVKWKTRRIKIDKKGRLVR